MPLICHCTLSQCTVNTFQRCFTNRLRKQISFPSVVPWPPFVLSGPSWKNFWRASPTAHPAISQTASFINKLKIPKYAGGLCYFCMIKEVISSIRLLLIGCSTEVYQFFLILSRIYVSFRFLTNASGSGKVRLLLEGLWKHWGFYFLAVGNIATHRFGSLDRSDMISRQIPNSQGFTSPERAGDSSRINPGQNRIIATHCVHRVLMARIIIFEYFMNAGQGKAF